LEQHHLIHISRSFRVALGNIRVMFRGFLAMFRSLRATFGNIRLTFRSYRATWSYFGSLCGMLQLLKRVCGFA